SVTSPHCIFALSFSADAHHRHLHSFPTRRSSDLLENFDLKTSSWAQTPSNIRELGGALFCDCRYEHVFVYHNGASSYFSSRGFRSEEHTSELQSRFDLVCRLLLEKKKNTYTHYKY